MSNSNTSATPADNRYNIPYVTPDRAHLHLVILRRFCVLYDITEDCRDEFLVCAEARYMYYLSLLDEYALRLHNDGRVASFANEMPLPPWDVAIVFHAHMLSPYRFITDMLYRDSRLLWQLGITFPLERLSQLIHEDVWTDVSSQTHWNAKYPQIPYQLWSTDPLKEGELELQDIRFKCPWCQSWSIIPLKDFTKMHRKKSPVCYCKSCRSLSTGSKRFSADTLSAKFLRDDLWHFLHYRNPWKVRGSCIDPVLGQFGEVDARHDLELILQPYSSEAPKQGLSWLLGLQRPQPPSTENLLYGVTTQSVSVSTWQEIIKTFKATTAQLRVHNVFKDLKKTTRFTSMRLYYRGTIWSECSIDLVSAAIRQRGFARKITADDLHELDTPERLARAITRYHKFMLLVKAKGEYEHLVPTLDIDLAWHTHQLLPRQYSDWCIQTLGRRVNHDDTIGEGDLQRGLKHTSLAWYKAYRAPYTPDHLPSQDIENPAVSLQIARAHYQAALINSGRARVRIPEGTVITPQSLGPRVTPLERTFLRFGPGLGMIMYPYWTMYPLGWRFPAACASGGAHDFGWGPGVGISSANCGNGLCAGGAGGSGGGGCGSGCGGGGGGGCGGGGGGCGSGGG